MSVPLFFLLKASVNIHWACDLVRFAGATLEEALACATINPAKMVKIDSICGSLEIGKPADIVVAREDSEQVFVIEYVLLGGKEI